MDVLHKQQWQIVLKFLECRENGSPDYPTHYGCFIGNADGTEKQNWDEPDFEDPRMALELLIKLVSYTISTA